jgi:hypothetical protein
MSHWQIELLKFGWVWKDRRELCGREVPYENNGAEQGMKMVVIELIHVYVTWNKDMLKRT